MLKVSELYIYPVKSLGGIKLDKAIVTDRGLEYDRRWMLIDDKNRFVSQREVPKMALLKTEISPDFLVVLDTANGTSIKVPLYYTTENLISVSVWDDLCQAILISTDIDAWFTKALNHNVRLVYMPDKSHRLVDSDYAYANQITSFADAFPFLLIGRSSLNDLNSRLDTAVQVDRFRPNIVFAGAEPYFEDRVNEFTINSIRFNGAKLCARCNMISIDQDKATSGKEPTKTLAEYRKRDKKIYFGQNLTHYGTGIISVGDELKILSLHTEDRFIISKN